MASKEETAVHTASSLSTLLERAKTGDSALVVQAYLDAGGLPTAMVELKYPNGDVLRVPLLHSMALRNAHPHRALAESVRMLVAAGADINAKSANRHGDSCTALMCAFKRKCCTKMLSALLQSGADPCQGAVESCKLLLARTDTALEQRDASGQTALTHAATGGHLSTVQLLLQHKADVNTVDGDNMTPLYMASMSDHVDVVACLLAAGANVHIVEASGHSAFAVAVQANSVAMAQLLLNHGADISFINKEGLDGVHLAACMGHVAMMELLVQRGLSVHAVDKYGNTPLMQAAMNGHTAAAEWLLQHGAAINAANNNGYTALLFASSSSGTA
eukprot:17899-Heterococcus_DN1.PRE.2